MNMKEVFDFEKINDFDEHIKLSIPNYTGLCDIFRALAIENMTIGGSCLDIGCSTGNFLNNLPRIDADYIGADICDIRNSSSKFKFMMEPAKKALREIGNLDVIVSMFTLQFLGRSERRETIKELKNHIDKGAVLLIAEKNYLNSAKINQVIQREHFNQKRKVFTGDQILEKDYQLFGSMFCKTSEEMVEELSYLGRFEQVWQSFNFKGWCVYK